jgi:hypothetical protein
MSTTPVVELMGSLELMEGKLWQARSKGKGRQINELCVTAAC